LEEERAIRASLEVELSGARRKDEALIWEVEESRRLAQGLREELSDKDTRVRELEIDLEEALAREGGKRVQLVSVSI